MMHFRVILFILLLALLSLSFQKYQTRVVDGGAYAARNKILNLSFDDGPNEQYTPAILNILDKYKIKGAIFFVVGKNIKPHLLQQILQRGHWVGSHSYSHARLSTLYNKRAGAPPDEIPKKGEEPPELSQLEADLQRNEELIQNATMKRPFLMRNPYGEHSHLVYSVLMKRSYVAHVLWTFDSFDWSCDADAECVVQQVGGYEHTLDGSSGILLLHERNATTAALDSVLDLIINERGYEVTSIAEFLEAEQRYHLFDRMECAKILFKQDVSALEYSMYHSQCKQLLQVSETEANAAESASKGSRHSERSNKGDDGDQDSVVTELFYKMMTKMSSNHEKLYSMMRDLKKMVTPSSSSGSEKARYNLPPNHPFAEAFKELDRALDKQAASRNVPHGEKEESRVKDGGASVNHLLLLSLGVNLLVVAAVLFLCMKRGRIR